MSPPTLDGVLSFCMAWDRGGLLRRANSWINYYLSTYLPPTPYGGIAARPNKGEGEKGEGNLGSYDMTRDDPSNEPNWQWRPPLSPPV